MNRLSDPRAHALRVQLPQITERFGPTLMNRCVEFSDGVAGVTPRSLSDALIDIHEDPAEVKEHKGSIFTPSGSGVWRREIGCVIHEFRTLLG